MKNCTSTLDLLVQGFKRLIRDVICPLFGLFLVYQLGVGTFDSAAIPMIVGLASALIGIPIWTRSDERHRGDSDEDSDGAPKRRRHKGISIKWDDGSDDQGGDGA